MVRHSPVVHRGVVIGERHEVEPRVVARVAEVLIGGALALGVAGVAVELAPVDAPVGTRFDPDRVRDRLQLAVGRARLEPVGAGLGEAKTLRDGDSIVAASEPRHHLAAHRELVARRARASIDSRSGPRCAPRRRTARRAPPPTAPARRPRPPRSFRTPPAPAIRWRRSVPCPRRRRRSAAAGCRCSRSGAGVPSSRPTDRRR